MHLSLIFPSRMFAPVMHATTDYWIVHSYGDEIVCEQQKQQRRQLGSRACRGSTLGIISVSNAGLYYASFWGCLGVLERKKSCNNDGTVEIITVQQPSSVHAPNEQNFLKPMKNIVLYHSTLT